MESERGYQEAESLRLPKRRKTAGLNGTNTAPDRDDWSAQSYNQYTIAWICALHIEMAAARAMLDETHDDLPRQLGDSNTYKLGAIGRHNVVIACLPNAQYGTNNASSVMTHLIRTFPSIKCGLMVGIGGGVPSQANVRLGDIVVGTRVMQHDLGKLLDEGKLQTTGIPRILPSSLGTVVSALRSKHEIGICQVPSILRQKLGEHPDYGRPSLPDQLFQTAYNHESATATCDGCDLSKLVLRSKRASDDPMIHYGAIGSGNQVIRDASVRDDIARRLDVICFEMEAAGLMDVCPCLSVRGICDYSDSHKNKEWQRYAAATAAAYATEFLETLPALGLASEATNEVVHRPGSSPDHRKQFLDSLRFAQIHARRHTIKSTQGKTCQWFLTHPEYQAWLSPERLAEHHGFLWIPGKPGAGKSTMMKFAYTKMQRSRRRDSVVASFFFNARGEILEKTMSGMYRSLLLQLLEGFPDLQHILDDPVLVGYEQDSISLITLKEILRNAVSALGSLSFTCFVDALDECDEQQVMDMVEFFEELAEETVNSGIELRICFASRHYPHIDIRRGHTLALENQPGHDQDLANYVQSRLRIRDTALMEELKSQILDKAAGVFMWVVLVVEILNDENRHGRMALRTRLAEVPSGLSDLFKNILRRDSDNMEDLLLSVLWILYARRPLSPGEYYHALWSGLYPKSLADPEIPNVSGPDANEMIHSYVISSSKGLAEITKSKEPSVQFIHESVRDFLIKDKGLLELWPDLGPEWESLGHERLKECCNSYLHHHFVRSFIYTPGSLLEKVPLFQYASLDILYHANAAADVFPQANFLSQLEPTSLASASNFFEKFKVRHYSTDASLLYMLSDKGFEKLICARMEDEDPLTPTPSERYNYPLFSAIANGHKNAVAALLNAFPTHLDGIDITDGLKHKRDPTNYKERTPLSWASQEGWTEIARLLLLQGANVNELDHGGETPLNRASTVEVAKLLIAAGANVNLPRGEPLRAAVRDHREAMVKLFIENGADVDGLRSDKLSPLMLAVRNGSEAMVKLLIKRGADTNYCSMYGALPLSEAVSGGHDWIAKFLIDKGANVNGTNEQGWSPLMAAVVPANVDIAKLLISLGADVNAKVTSGATALFFASSVGCEILVRLLVEAGANLNVVDSNSIGRTPLLMALANGHETIAQLLIESGADVDVKDLSGQSALQIAQENGLDIAMRSLITQRR